MEPLFDALPDVVFFVKDRDARYLCVNQTLVRRCGSETKADLIGRTCQDVFEGPMGAGYLEQDQHILRGDGALRDVLELHLYARGGPGWCITTKLPLHDSEGKIIGIVGVSNDIHVSVSQDRRYAELAKGVDFIRQHYDDALRLDSLAELCGLSAYQFEERMKKVFQLTVGQFIAKTRIDAACRSLEQGSSSIADVAVTCGFADQSAFTRQFKATTGMTPTDYRKSVINR